MFQKLIYTAGIVAAVIAVVVILTAAMPAIKAFTDVAANDTTVGNYAGYKEAAATAPIWMYAIPFLVGGVSIFMVLRKKES
ncbi:hypothetical protein KKE60_04775 [Patescibacteria group bacterium]|nr:hypothetical protein [Patescibacteria group bacterium]